MPAGTSNPHTLMQSPQNERKGFRFVLFLRTAPGPDTQVGSTTLEKNKNLREDGRYGSGFRYLLTGPFEEQRYKHTITRNAEKTRLDRTEKESLRVEESPS